MAQAQGGANGDLAPITSIPTGLLLGEACLHFFHNPFVRFAGRRGILAVEVIIAALLVLLAPSVALDILMGIGALAVVLVCAYLIWYERFTRRIGNLRPLCFHCTSIIWQLCCGRCRGPLPELALWLKGAFLGRCPHCGIRLSVRGKTLLAWCSTCSETRLMPDILFWKRSHVILWVATSLPRKVAGGWTLLRREGEHKMVLCQDGNKDSALLMLITDEYRSPDLPIEEHLVNQTRLLLVSRDVPEAHAERIKGFFDARRTIFERVSPIR